MKSKKKQIEKIAKKLLAEINKNLINHSDRNCSDELYDDYISLMNYFNVNYKKDKLDLEVQLITLKDQLNSIIGIFNCNFRKKLLNEIIKTEVELYKLNELLIKKDE